MHKVMRTAVVTALFAIAPIAAQAEGQGFVTVSAGQARNQPHGTDAFYYDTSDYPGLNYRQSVDKTDVAFGITGGYRWAIDDVYSIGPEAGFVDLGSLKTRATASLPGQFDEINHSKISNKAVLIGVNAKWMLGSTTKWNLTARTGVIHVMTRLHADYTDLDYYAGTTSSYSASTKHSSNDNGFYGALSVGYDFTRNVGVSLGYEHYHSSYRTGRYYSYLSESVSQNIGVWTASAEFRF